jgi:adenosylcobinamide-phosphate synthase
MRGQIHLVIAALAIAIEAAFGYPAPLFRAIRHPVVWIGAMIAMLDRRLNREDMPDSMRRLNGVIALFILVAVPVGVAVIIEAGLARYFPGGIAVILGAIFVSSFIAQRSLWAHVAAVATALEQDGLVAGRSAVSRIVGRNPETLDAAAVARAAIESLAENFSDGVVAPVFWCAALGLPGIVAYKSINTADSMIGHRTPRYQAFGWASARFDDFVNLPASRLAALWIALSALIHPNLDARGAFKAIRRDAKKHRSPNAGWPEAAMAGALGLRLAGPRIYGATLTADAWMGDGRAQATAADIRDALSLYRAACAIQFAFVAGLAIIIAQG